jgi:hypothetical protein
MVHYTSSKRRLTDSATPVALVRLRGRITRHIVTQQPFARGGVEQSQQRKPDDNCQKNNIQHDNYLQRPFRDALQCAPMLKGSRRRDGMEIPLDRQMPAGTNVRGSV